MSEYLWDRIGPPDPEVENLERLLEPLAHRGEMRLPNARRIPYAAIAASILVGVLAWRLLPSAISRPTSWTISEIDGNVRAGNQAAKTSARLYTGEDLRTGDSARVALDAEDFGRVDVRAGSEVRIVESGAGRQRMELRRGAIHALIWAPPRRFVVDTPSARAIDLGCQYELSVDANGDGLLSVETGWVAFEHRGLESFIPAGASCRTVRARGPGTPFFADAAPEFRQSLEQYEASGDLASLHRVLEIARPKDGLTLWHLLSRVPAAERPIVFDRFAQLVPIPPGVSRERALVLDRAVLDRCWNALGLDDAEWWRVWKRE
jgi:hypothetical protein